MTANVGTIDRILRAALGVVLLSLALSSDLPIFDGVVMKYGTILIAVIMFAVAVTRVCPVYTILDLKTCRS